MRNGAERRGTEGQEWMGPEWRGVDWMGSERLEWMGEEWRGPEGKGRSRSERLEWMGEEWRGPEGKGRSRSEGRGLDRSELERQECTGKDRQERRRNVARHAKVNEDGQVETGPGVDDEVDRKEVLRDRFEKASEVLLTMSLKMIHSFIDGNYRSRRVQEGLRVAKELAEAGQRMLNNSK